MTSLRLRLLAQTLPFLLVLPGVALAQAGPPSRAEAEAALNPGAPAAAYTAQQLDQMVAPVALYPDQLLSQVLMAASYPQQLLDAAQWLEDPSNAGIKGNALAAALQPLPWDPSVKALVAFPQIVVMLTEHIDWTQTLGVAFATQQPQVMAQIQSLRHLAMRSGHLSGIHQIVFRTEGADVVILPADQNEIYVPVYNPVVVYGSYWPAPQFPPVYIPPPSGFVSATIAEGIQVSVGYAVVAPLWGWSHWDWRHHSITINRADYTRITRNVYIGPGGAWRHHGPVALVAASEAARFTHGQRTAAAPKGTVEPARAAAVAALPRRAAAEPNRIHAASPHPEAEAAAHRGAASSAPPAHPGERQAVIPPAGHAPASEPAATARQAEHPAGPRPEQRAGVRPEQTAPHPAAASRPEEHAAIRPEHAAPHPAAPHEAAPPRSEEHAAIRPEHAAPHPAMPHAAAPPRSEEHAAIRPEHAAPHPAVPHAAAPPRSEEHAAIRPEHAAPHPAVPHAAAPAAHPAAAAPHPAAPPHQAAAAGGHPPAHPDEKKD